MQNHVHEQNTRLAVQDPLSMTGCVFSLFGQAKEVSMNSILHQVFQKVLTSTALHGVELKPEIQEIHLEGGLFLLALRYLFGWAVIEEDMASKQFAKKTAKTDSLSRSAALIRTLCSLPIAAIEIDDLI